MVTRSRGLTRTSRRLDLVAGLLELVLDQRERERRAVDRALDVRQHVRHRADVILVAVRQHQRGDREALERPEVRDDRGRRRAARAPETSRRHQRGWRCRRRRSPSCSCRTRRRRRAARSRAARRCPRNQQDSCVSSVRSSSSGGLRPPNPLAPSLAGAPCPAPLRRARLRRAWVSKMESQPHRSGAQTCANHEHEHGNAAAIVRADGPWRWAAGAAETPCSSTRRWDSRPKREQNDNTG